MKYNFDSSKIRVNWSACMYHIIDLHIDHEEEVFRRVFPFEKESENVVRSKDAKRILERDIIDVFCWTSRRYKYAVDLLWRRTVVASNFISIERFSRKSKSNGGINISLYGRVSATLARRAPRFSIGLFPLSPFFPRALKRTAASPRATNQPCPLMETTKYSRSSKQLLDVCPRINQSRRCQWI